MTAHQPKPKLLFDEGLPPRTYLPKLNRSFDCKHIKHDFHKGGAEDSVVYAIACQQERLLITFNVKDFKALMRPGGVSIIGLSTRLANKQIDLKLNSLVRNLKSAQYYGQYFSITASLRN